jgi:hypothetical protein
MRDNAVPFQARLRALALILGLRLYAPDADDGQAPRLARTHTYPPRALSPRPRLRLYQEED